MSQPSRWIDKDCKVLINSRILEALCLEQCTLSYDKTCPVMTKPRSLIIAFVIRCLDSIIPLIFYIQNFKPLASLCSWADRFEYNLVKNPEDRFPRDHYDYEVNFRTARSSVAFADFVEMSEIKVEPGWMQSWLHGNVWDQSGTRLDAKQTSWKCLRSKWNQVGR